MKPYTPSEHLEKLSDLADSVIGSEQAGRLWALVDDMPSGTTVAEITALLVAGR
jgi:hypothetical protein